MALRIKKTGSSRIAKIELMSHADAVAQYDDYNERDVDALLTFVANPKAPGRGTSYRRFSAYSEAKTLSQYMDICDESPLFNGGFDKKGYADLIHDIQFGFITMTEPENKPKK